MTGLAAFKFKLAQICCTIVSILTSIFTYFMLCVCHAWKLRFAAAHREFLLMDRDALCIEEISRKDFNPMPALFTDDDVHEQIEISKELFLVVSCHRCPLFAPAS